MEVRIATLQASSIDMSATRHIALSTSACTLAWKINSALVLHYEVLQQQEPAGHLSAEVADDAADMPLELRRWKPFAMGPFSLT